MPAPDPSQDEPAHDTADEPLTREQWIARHVARAPKITPQQWADTLLLLGTRNRDGDESDDEQKAS